MMFKGTDKRTAEDVNKDFDSLGAVNNAFTSSEMTAYWAHVLPEKMDDTIEILADILRPSLREEDRANLVVIGLNPQPGVTACSRISGEPLYCRFLQDSTLHCLAQSQAGGSRRGKKRNRPET